MAKVKFKRFISDSAVESAEIEDGSFIVSKSGTSYVDFGNERIAFGGTSDTAMSDTSINSVQNKVIKSYVDDVKIDVQNAQTDINNLQTFSTTETVIGTWIDGKPIYRKVFTNLVIAPNTAFYVSIGESIDTYVRLFGSANINVGNNNGVYDPMPNVNTTDSNYNIGLRGHNNISSNHPNDVRISTGSGTSLRNGFLVVEYTKTTD